jgi:hypothetical protein
VESEETPVAKEQHANDMWPGIFMQAMPRFRANWYEHNRWTLEAPRLYRKRIFSSELDSVRKLVAEENKQKSQIAVWCWRKMAANL